MDLTIRRVHRLSDDLVNKIAAGEVVERPASVVKELVENALDAGARSIQIEIEGGGRKLIRVRDDGCGMGRDDAEAAVERHATSKLRELIDLQSILTHGFRGEALPSIASVAELVLRTCEADASSGTEVVVRHGQRQHVRDVGHPRGTTVEVSDLFGAVPARRKFLRSDVTESGHVAEAVTLLALARPDVGFFLSSNGRRLLEAPPVPGLADRLYQTFGEERLDSLAPVDGGESWARVSGFVARLDGPPGARAAVRLFVNGRAVRDRALLKAVAEGYRAAGAGSRAPEGFLFIEAPPHMVDVNVHPAKTEVRFADPRTVWTAVERSVRNALGGVRVQAAPVPAGDPGRVAEAVERYVSRLDEAGTPPDGFRTAAAAAILSGTPAVLHAEPVLVLGQHRDTYIVTSDGRDLVLVDQHTAHERVRFEALVSRVERRAAESQGLLVPVVHTLPPSLRPVLEEHQASLALLGFDVEAFGGDSVRIGALPALLGPKDPGRALEALLRDLDEREDSDWSVSGARDRIAATLACHSAVRAGQALSRESMAAIVRDLAATRHPMTCPHGRPTTARIPQDDVARWFGRTGWRRR